MKSSLSSAQHITEQKDAIAALAEQLAEIDSLYRTCPVGLAVLDRNARFLRINEALANINGVPLSKHLGRSAWDIVPSLRSKVEPILESVIERGETVVAQISGQTPREPGVTRYWTEKWYPVRDTEGRVVAAGVTVEEITERIAAEERQKTFTSELSHRVKNTLAVVQSIAAQTFRGLPEAAPALKSFNNRLMALAGAHSLLTASHWHGARLDQILKQALNPFGAERTPGPFQISGPPVQLPPTMVTSLSLMFHELGTNAAKYGALSAPSGRITIQWQLRRVEREAEFIELVWTELGGPPPAERREQSGFGSRLLQFGAAQLGGTVKLDYAKDGLTCHIRFPSPTASDFLAGND